MRSHTRGHAFAPPSSPNQPARRKRQASADRRWFGLCASDAATDGADTERAAEEVFTKALQDSGTKDSDIGIIVSTGYGRRIFKKAHKIITENKMT